MEGRLYSKHEQWHVSVKDTQNLLFITPYICNVYLKKTEKQNKFFTMV